MTQEALDKQISNAIYLCNDRDYDTVSPALFQRSLSLDFSEGLRVFKELVGMGIIIHYWLEGEIDEKDEESRENYIGQIDKAFLKKHLQN